MENRIIYIKNNGYISKILDNLYLGDAESSQDKDLLNSYNIKFIINLSNREKYDKYENINYYDIYINDKYYENIEKYFSICNEIIENCISNNIKILVHCESGVSRSVSIILAFLMYYRYNLKESIEYLKNIRENQYVRPNIGFFKQLLKYENEIYGIKSMKLVNFEKI